MCCCDDQLGKLARVYGLRGLGAVGIPAGSKVRVGFRYSCATCLPGSVPEPSQITTSVGGCLQTTGAFYYVNSEVSKGIIYQDYLTIRAQTQRDFNSGEDLVIFIRSTLNSCYPPFANLIDDNDPVVIDELPVSISPPGTMPIPGSQQAGGGSQPSIGQQISSLFGGASIGGTGTTTLLLLVVGAVVLAKTLK